MKDQCWVTLAQNDGEGWGAMVLARSIRETLSPRRIVITISENVSHPIKVLLQREFDSVIRFNNSEVGNTALAKLWLWNLRSWGKCVYISPFSLMMQNLDELFEKSEFSAQVCAETGRFGINVFVFEPNLQTFDRLMDLTKQVKGDCSAVLNFHFNSNLSNQKFELASNVRADFKTMNSNRGSSNWNVIQFGELPLIAKMKAQSTPWMEEMLYKWAATFVHEVVPQVGKLEDSTREFLWKSLEKHNLPTTNGPAPPTSDLDNLSEVGDAIAIVGMSCRFPSANNAAEFWDLLISSQDPIRKFPADRPRPAHFNEADERLWFQAGFLGCPVDEFDAKFFGISPREAPFVDPQQRLLLEVIWESLENANINPQSLKETNTGVFVGIWQQEYDKLLPDSGLTANEFHHRYLGNAFSATASRISHFLGLYGPNYSIESGCSSSSSGIHLACESLRRGETSLAIASGVNLVLHLINPLGGDDKDAVVLSSDFRCKTFDERADGFVRAEGCGALVLKSFREAVRMGDNILGLIRGTALNNDGPATSFGTPNAKAQERVFREALANANIAPNQVSVVEAHGTGTIVGDPTEMYAIGQVYSEGRTTPLIVSSVKTNIGHAESCAGIAGLIKILLCIQYKTIPPHLHLQKLNPRINLESIPAVIPLEITKWTSDAPRIAAVSSFSMSGTNVHIIVQEPPITLNTLKKSNPKPLHMIGISTKSEEALQSLCSNYISFFKAHPELRLEDVAYSLNTGRANMPYRIGVVAKDMEQLIGKLEKKTYITGKASQQRQKIVFLFTGQGSQYFGMAKRLYEVSAVFHSALDHCDILFQRQLSISLRKVLWDDASLLERTIYCQPAIFCVQVSLVELWKTFGIRPDYVVGHSVGEFGASVCAGALTVEDGMKLVVGRSRLVNSLEGGKMLALNTSPNKTRILIKEFSLKVCESQIDIAAENSEEEVVVSGMETHVKEFGDFCFSKGIKAQLISASHAFHSRQMDVVLNEFGKLAAEISIGELHCGYISGTLAREISEAEFGSSYWQRHLRDTVRFAEALKVAWEQPCNGRVFIEIGTQPILLGLAMGNLRDSSPGTFSPSLRRSEDDLGSFMNSLSKLYVAGVDICWNSWLNGGKKIHLPTYPFQRVKYWYSPEEDVAPLPRILHPILGRRIPSPLSDQIYTQILSLKDLAYVGDHKVAEHAILPAAAYLETIMAAGCQVLQGGQARVPFTVEELTVEAPLELQKASQIQTVLRSIGGEAGAKFEIGIYKQVSIEDLDKWKRHATASFSPCMRDASGIAANLDEIKSRMQVNAKVEEAYEAIAQVGIQFGPKFQSIAQAWTGEKELLTEIKTPDDAQNYICHPIVLDAMIQTFAFRTALAASNATTLTLQLPISLKTFTWLSRDNSRTLYAYTTWTAEDSLGCVYLYNENGETMALMEGLEMLKTDVGSFLRVLNAESNPLPPFLEEIWRPTCGFTRNRLNTSQFWLEPMNLTQRVLEECNRVKETQIHLRQLSQELFVMYLARSVLECHWPWPAIGEKIQNQDWTALAPSYLQIVKNGTLFRIFESAGYLKETGPDSYEILKNLPKLESLEIEITAKLNEGINIATEEDVFIQYVKRCGLHLTSVLQGKMSPIAYLFPSEASEVGALRLYEEAIGVKDISDLTTAVAVDIIRSAAKGNGGVVRILEVGAGSGVCCKLTLEALTELHIPYQYTFTDISPLFLHEAKNSFEKGVTFALLDIEQDPLSQGFAPEEYDVIIGSMVVHATADIGVTLQNLHLLLRPGGILALGELFVEYLFETLSFGFLEGWWRFSDSRIQSPMLTQTEWKATLKANGFQDGTTIEMLDSHGAVIGRKPELHPEIMVNKTGVPQKTWIIVSDASNLDISIAQKMAAVGRNVVSYKTEASFPSGLEGILYFWTTSAKTLVVDQSRCEQLLSLCQKLAKSYQDVKTRPKLVLVTRGVNYLGDAGPGDPNAATGLCLLKTFVNENPDFVIRVIDADQDEENAEREVEEIFAQVWPKEREMFTAVRKDKVFVQRLVSATRRKIPVQFPNSTRFKIHAPPSKSLNDLEISVVPRVEPVEDQVEITVRATALNFRDIFMILRPEGFDIPEYMDKDPGLDIAGVVTALGPACTKLRIGDEVIGFSKTGSLASHAVISERTLLRKPPGMTFTSAATIPCAYLTVFYSLFECAEIRRGDRVLIHVATGGVGLAAIQVAREAGAEIFATAGSRRKRAYLRFIGIKYVYHSRNTDFGDHILHDTNGAGVTIVLNSLTGPNFKETSLRACATGARFVEIGKMNIWSVEDVKALRPDITYFIVDLAVMAYKEPERMLRHSDLMESEFEKGIYFGLPHATFPLDLIREAFHYFQEAKHIGKIVVSIPVPEVSPEGRISFRSPLFHKESTYLITGGLGGLGMEVAKWMSSSGATNIVLTGRSPPGFRSLDLIGKLMKDGTRVYVIQADVGKWAECEALLETIKILNLPHLRGIMHAAGILSDGILPNQSWDKFEAVFQPKVHGTWNLHQLTLYYDLEFFAMFSSVSDIIGNPGQSNHGAANRFMDSFTHYRLSMGLPATTMNFGPWSDVGAAANIRLSLDTMMGFRSMSPKQGIAAIEKVFRERATQSVILDITDWSALKQVIRLGHYLDEMKSESTAVENRFEAYKEIIEEIQRSEPGDRQAKIEDFLEKVLKETLRIPENEQLDRDQNFSELGVDSLMAMELRNKLQGMLGDKQLTVTALQENRTIRSLSAHMALLMTSGESGSIPIEQLVAQDSVLPPEISATSIPPCNPEEVREIFLTGATGHLGLHFIPAIQSQSLEIKITCLVRGRNVEDAQSRILKIATQYSLQDKIIWENVNVICGDLVRPQFGLPLEKYEELAEKIDAIMHFAVKSNHLEEYNSACNGEKNLRNQIVGATLNILKFAGACKTKRLFYASSLLAVGEVSDDGILLEDFPKEKNGEGIKNGYCIAKFVCEKLCGQAAERGIPVTVIRYASIFGQSSTGFLPTDKNHSWGILLACIRVRKFPQFDQNGLPFMAVDTAASISTKIFLKDDSEEGVYNLTSSSTVTQDEIRDTFKKFGVDGNFVPFSEWRDSVFEELDVKNNVLAPFLTLYEDDQSTREQKYLKLHPLANSISRIQMNTISRKVKRNFPEVEQEIASAKDLLQLHLQFHFDSLRKIK